MTVFLLECKEDEKDETNFAEEDSPSFSQIMVSFADGAILMEINDK